MLTSYTTVKIFLWTVSYRYMQKQMFSGFSDMRHVIVIFFHFHFLALNIYILLTYYYMSVAASFFPRNCKARKHILRWHGKNTL